MKRSALDSDVVNPYMCAHGGVERVSKIAHAQLVRTLLIGSALFPRRYTGLRRCDMAYERVGTIEETLQRVQGEFRQMPGLRLTPAQASRLWGLDAIASQALLEALVDARFLRRAPDGSFMRPVDTERRRA